MTAERPLADAQKTSAALTAVRVFGGLGLIPFYLPMLAPVMAPALTPPPIGPKHFTQA